MLENVHFDEARQSQLTALELLCALGYRYISADEALRERGGDTGNFLLAGIAREKLMDINDFEVDGTMFKFSEKDVYDAVEELERMPYEGLMDTAQKIFNMVMPASGGKTIKVHAGGRMVSKNFRFIDFEHPERNVFHVTAEYTVSGKENIRPDIVCFVNGIPFAVIENKRSSVPVTDALKQMVRNQSADFCPKFFAYTQLLIATNDTELLYGTTGTPSKFYAAWKEMYVSTAEAETYVRGLIARPIEGAVYQQILADLRCSGDGYRQKTDRVPSAQDYGIAYVFEPKRLLDLTKNYIVFDGGEKKISRYQQYFAIHKMLDRIAERETTPSGITRRTGGLVWHTQGSGKSLTMVMFVKALIEHPQISNPRVIIVTDRKDLDKQIKGTFEKCNLKKDVVQATSGQHLLDLIKEKNLAVITTLVHKFETAARKKAGFVDNDQNIFVLIDEAHRTQGGIANLEMNRIIPNACYIGFTGTPLMKSEKESWRKFGGYIGKPYTIVDALEDKVILPLIYEGRYAPMIQYADQIDRRVDRVYEDMSRKYVTGNITLNKKILQQEMTAKTVRSNPQRIEEIARDIEKHFLASFKDTGLKAQIVAPSKYAAIVFQKFFENRGAIRTAVVISDEHDDGDEEDGRKKEIITYLNGLRERQGTLAKYEDAVIGSFKKNDDGIEVIIVVDKLLTGFDAPRNTVLYLAKDLRDHNLLQAIARVNRLYDNDKAPKTAGFIIDYSENAKNIDTAMKLFGNYDIDDVRGTLVDVSEKITELEQSRAQLHDIFREVKNSSDDEVFLQHLNDESKRKLFYTSLNHFIRTFNECFVLQNFVHEFKDLDRYRRELKKFIELRKGANLRYADRIDLSEFRLSLVRILDAYINAQEVELLTKPVVITDRKQFEEALAGLGSTASKAEAVAAQSQRTITEKMDSDPEFYERFSLKISELLEKMHAGKMADIAVLKQLKLVHEELVNKQDDSLPPAVAATKGADILFRNVRSVFSALNVDEDTYIGIVLDIVAIIKKEAIVDWHKNPDVKRRMRNAIDDYLYDVLKKGRGIGLSEEDIKKVVTDALALAENNYEIFS